MPGYKPILVFVLLLLLAGLACSLPARGESTPTPIPTVDPQILEDQLATSAAEFRETGQLSLSFSEQQLTSYVAQELARQPDIPITEPYVSLQGGQMILTGNVKVGLVTAPAEVIFEPSIQDKDLRVTVLSAKFGSLPLPDGILEQINQTVNQNLGSFIILEGQPIDVESVEIADGMLQLTGKAR